MFILTNISNLKQYNNFFINNEFDYCEKMITKHPRSEGRQWIENDILNIDKYMENIVGNKGDLQDNLF